MDKTGVKKFLVRLRPLLLLLVAWVIIVLLIQRWILFPRYLIKPEPHAGENVPSLERLYVSAGSRQVEGWLLPGRGVSAERPGPAVIFAHGNGELIDLWAEPLTELRRLGVSVLLPEYRGYGRSGGWPSQEGITEDYVKFYDLLSARPEVDSGRIVFFGRSIGGGVVCSLSRHRKPRAMILMSTFTSVTRMARRYLVPSFLVRDPFDNLTAVSRLDIPLLLIHGRQDSLVPHQHSEQLHAAAPQSKLVSYDADHNDCPPSWPLFWEELEGFLQGAGILKSRNPKPVKTP